MNLNPASIVDLEKRVDLNLNVVFPKLTLRPQGFGANTSDGILTSDVIGAIPTGGAIFPLKTGTLGVGLYLPLGGGVDFGHSRNVVAAASPDESDRRLEYIHGQLTLAYAYRFESGWAVGAALFGSLTRCRTDHATTYVISTQGANRWDDAFGVGFGLGIYRRWERFAIGASYTSPNWSQRLTKYGDLLWYPVDLPQAVQAGIAVKLTPHWELTLDFKYQDWGAMDFFGRKTAEAGLGWRDQRAIKAGLEWKAAERITLMAGFSHANTPIDEDHVFASALEPACVEDHVTAGVTIAINPRAQFHIVFLHAFSNSLTETGQGDLYSLLGRGTEITTSANSISLGYTMLF